MDKIKIYGISDKKGDVRYIGKTKRSIEHRLKEHKSDNRKSYKYYWLKKLNDNVEIFLIDEVPDNESNYWEIFYISLFKSWGFNLTNLTEGGDGGKGFSHTDETKKFISECSKKQIFSEERKLKISKSKKGKKFPKISESKKGYKHSEETKIKIGEKSKGRKAWNSGLTKETDDRIKKMGESQKNKLISEEMKEKISKKLKGKKKPNQLIIKSVLNRKKASIEKGFYHSEETKLKIKKANMGHIVTNETRKKISKNCTKYNTEILTQIKKLIGDGFDKKYISKKLNIPYGSLGYLIRKRLQLVP